MCVEWLIVSLNGAAFQGACVLLFVHADACRHHNINEHQELIYNNSHPSICELIEPSTKRASARVKRQ